MSESDDQLSAAEEDRVGVDDIVRQHESASSDNDAETSRHHVVGDTSMDQEPEETDGEALGATAQKQDPKKRVVRKMILLNTERLKGRKGVHTIEKLYQGFEFRGKGREAEDLDRLMKRLEYWAFRLFPKLEFDDFLAKCEALGHKKDLHTHLKKYRLEMIDADYCGVDDSTARDDDMIEDESTDAAVAALVNTERELLREIADENFERLLAETEMPTE